MAAGDCSLRAWPVLLLLFSENLLGGGPTEAEAGRVLGLFHMPAPSHFVMFEKLMKELAARGHEVSVVSHFPQQSPVANYTDVGVAGAVPPLSFTLPDLLEFDVMNFLFKECVPICERVLHHPNVQKLILSPGQYDLVVVQIFSADCGYGIAWKFGAPVIGISSLTRMPWAQFRVGNPENPAYFPLAYTPYSTQMTFWQRVHNTLKLIYMTVTERLQSYPAMEDINRRMFGPEIPLLEDLLYNTSLVLLNSHFSLNGALPAVPAVVEVGGLHVHPTRRPLPQTLAEWLDGASQAGVVYVSFGSLARVEEMPLPQLRAMISALESLPQRVLWKCQGSTVAKLLGRDLGPNILTEKWMPQADVLAHPKVRVFVSHGGLMGTQESVFWGKPMLVVPLFADQFQNANNLVDKGMAVKLIIQEINEESFSKSLRTLLGDPSYSGNARRLSALFRDRPRPPLQEAVFWSEYVMRHAGAPHLRSAAVRLRWWQHWLLDVAAAALAALAAILAAGLLLFRLLCRLFCRRERRDKVKRS